MGQPRDATWETDFLWASVFATSAGSVTLTSGSNTQSFPVVTGVNLLKLALSPGTLAVSMTRNGQTVLKGASTGYTYVTNPVLYNFNPFVSSASGACELFRSLRPELHHLTITSSLLIKSSLAFHHLRRRLLLLRLLLCQLAPLQSQVVGSPKAASSIPLQGSCPVLGRRALL